MKEDGIDMSEQERKNRYGSTNNPKYLAFRITLAPYFTDSALCMHGASFILLATE
jgi:hypothetical protein